MGDFTWLPAAGHYLDADGAVVPESEIRASLDALIAHGQGRTAVLAQRLAEGQLDILSFRTEMGAEIRQVASASAMLAHGGRAQMTASERGWLGSQVRVQNDFLSVLSLDWSQGRMTPAQLAARLSMYPEAAGRGLYYAARQRDRVAAGAEQERRVLGGAEHCADCPGLAARGWQPAGSLPPPGSGCACRSRCKCSMEWRTVPARVATEAA